MKPTFIPYNKDLKNRAREMRNYPTKTERIFWYEVLRNKKFLGFGFLRQKILLNYIVDFYCSKLSLAIELDGISHLDNKKYDQKRTQDLANYGIKIIRYYNDEVLEGIDNISLDLEEKIKQRKKQLGF